MGRLKEEKQVKSHLKSGLMSFQKNIQQGLNSMIYLMEADGVLLIHVVMVFAVFMLLQLIFKLTTLPILTLC
jgi:hypothetical protein